MRFVLAQQSIREGRAFGPKTTPTRTSRARTPRTPSPWPPRCRSQQHTARRAPSGRPRPSTCRRRTGRTRAARPAAQGAHAAGGGGAQRAGGARRAGGGAGLRGVGARAAQGELSLSEEPRNRYSDGRVPVRSMRSDTHSSPTPPTLIAPPCSASPCKGRLGEGAALGATAFAPGMTASLSLGSAPAPPPSPPPTRPVKPHHPVMVLFPAPNRLLPAATAYCMRRRPMGRGSRAPCGGDTATETDPADGDQLSSRA